MKPYGIIYLLINKVNGKMYVGQTINFNKRMIQHKNSKAIDYLHRAIRKIGWDNFDKYIIDICFTHREDLNQLEIHYIDYFSTILFGYNLSIGGLGGGHTPTSKTKKKISDTLTGKFSGQNNPRYLTIEKFKIKLAEKHEDNIILDESTYKNVHTKARFSHKVHGEWWTVPGSLIYGSTKMPVKEMARINGKSVQCNETGMFFPSLSACARYFNVSPSNICAVLNNRSKTCKGFTFSYV